MSESEPDEEPEPEPRRRARAPNRQPPTPERRGESWWVSVGLGIVYAAVAVGAVLFAVGVVFAVFDRVGIYVAVAVAGVLMFGYGYTLIRVLDAVVEWRG